jgi:hypothetical protein
MHTCHYSNGSGKMVILRCIGEDSFFLEKVIFPFEEWLFSCPDGSRIEIWSHGLSGAELLDAMAAEDLRCAQDGSEPGLPAPLTAGVTAASSPLLTCMA